MKRKKHPDVFLKEFLSDGEENLMIDDAQPLLAVQRVKSV
jgi:hypothetical protein